MMPTTNETTEKVISLIRGALVSYRHMLDNRHTASYAQEVAFGEIDVPVFFEHLLDELDGETKARREAQAQLYAERERHTAQVKKMQAEIGRLQALATTEHDCSRSHPHENMSPMCELRTEIARLRNENTRLKHSTTERKGEPGLFATEVQPQPLRHPLDDYHRAPSEGPLNATWQDKPHRLLYDLIAALAYYTAPQATERKGEPLHPDDMAVDRFAVAMKSKLAASRAKGRGGWDDPRQCTLEHLARLLINHISKGDPVDVANFAMMLHQRGADRSVLIRASQLQEIAAPEPTPAALADSAGSQWCDHCNSAVITSCKAPRVDVCPKGLAVTNERKAGVA